MKIIVKRNQKTSSDTSKKLVIKRNFALCKYQLPTVDDIATGDYYSIIDHVEESKTKAGKDSITVYYKIADAREVYKKVNKLLPKGKSVNIKYIYQKYPLDTPFYDRFINAMYSYYEVEDNELNFDDIIGTPEIITISYSKLDAIGGISDRFYCYPGFFENSQDKEKYVEEIPKKLPDESLDDDEDYEDFDFDLFED